jgi:hypothetical protein
MTTNTVNPLQAFNTFFKQAQEGARMSVKMTENFLVESDKQAQESLKWMNTAHEQMVTGRAQAFKVWTEMAERSAAVGQQMADAAAAAWQVK